MADRTRLAALLWLTLAFTVWNVVFDRILVLAGRAYLHAATVAAEAARPYILVGPWMAAAQSQALRSATLAGAAVLLVGAVGIAAAVRRGQP